MKDLLQSLGIENKECSHLKTKVLDTRRKGNKICRVRYCKDCEEKFETVELISEAEPEEVCHYENLKKMLDNTEKEIIFKVQPYLIALIKQEISNG